MIMKRVNVKPAMAGPEWSSITAARKKIPALMAHAI